MFIENGITLKDRSRCKKDTARITVHKFALNSWRIILHFSVENDNIGK